MKNLLRRFALLLLPFLLCAVLPAVAQSTVPVPVVGNINTVSGVPAGPNNYIEFTLVNCGSTQPTVNGVAVMLNSPVDFYQGPNSTLTLQDGVTPATLYGNDIVACGSIGNTSRYQEQQFVNSQPAGPSKFYFVQSGSGLTFNINLARPISVLPPLKYPNPNACAPGTTQTGLNNDLSPVCTNLPSGASNAVVTNAAGTQNVAQPNGTSLNVQGLLQTLTTTDKLPQANVMHSDFGKSCSNAADPTDTLDSTCAINAAITFSLTRPIQSQSTPCVYIPAGIYKVTATLNMPSCLHGDSRQATIIDASGLGTNNLFTLKNTGAPGGARKLFGGVLIYDLQVTGADLLQTGSAFEFNNADDVTITRVAVTNWAGRCFNLYGDSERNVFYDDRCNSSNITVDLGFQANENIFKDVYSLFPGQTANTNLQYHTGINTDPTTHLYPAANGGVCLNFPPWAANTVTPKGSVICDSNGNIEVATTYGTTGATAPTWVTAGLTMTCDGSTSDCTSAKIPFGKTDWTGPENWENVLSSTLIIPDPTPAVFLSGNKNVWDGGSDKSLLSTSAIANIGVTNVVQNVYCEASPFGGRPGNAFCVWSGDVDAGVTSSFTTAALTATATTIPVVSSMYFYDGHLGTDADAAAGNSPIGFEIACPDYDPTSSASCAAPFASFLKNQLEKVSISAFSNQNNGFVTSGGRCSSGSTVTCTAGTGVAWPTGAIVMLALNGASTVHVSNIHSTAVNGRGSAGYFLLSSETLNTTLADGRKTSLAVGDFGVGARPDGRAFTNIDATVSGFGGNGAGSMILDNYSPTTGTDQYDNQAGVVIPLGMDSLIVSSNEPGISGVNLPTGITVGSYDNYVRPGIQIAVHGSKFTHGTAVRSTLGEVWTFGPNGGQEYMRQIRLGTFDASGGANSMVSGFQFANQFCLADIPGLNATGTQPSMRTCNEGGPATTGFNARWHLDLFQGGAWSPIDTIDQNGLHQYNVGVPGIGQSANLLRNSNNLNGAGWAASSGAPTITITGGQADPFGGTNAEQVIVGASTGNFNFVNTASATFATGQTLTGCVWLKGNAGGEQILFDADTTGNVAPAFQAGGTAGLTTSWFRYCGTGVGVSTNVPFRWGEGTAVPAQTFFIYNPQTQAGTTAGPDLLTTTTSVFTPQSTLSAQNVESNGVALPTVGNPTVGHAACIKSGPPVVIGFCSTVVASDGSCTCN